MAKLAIQGLALLGAAVTVGFLTYAAGSFPADPFSLGLAVWGVGPFALMFLSSFLLPSGGTSRFFLAAGCAFLVAASAFLFRDAFFVHLDPQSALVFLFLPVYQFVAFGILYALARLAGRRPVSKQGAA